MLFPSIQAVFVVKSCECNEEGKIAVNFTVKPDVQKLVDLEYDGVKIDSCGPNHDVAYFAELINQSGRKILIEDCNDEATNTHQCNGNFFRSGADLFGTWGAITDRIQNIPRLLGFDSDPDTAVSGPGCWAYPGISLHTHIVSANRYAPTFSYLLCSLLHRYVASWNYEDRWIGQELH
jgi:hypothetical protein